MRQVINFNRKWAFTKMADAVPETMPTKWDDFLDLCKDLKDGIKASGKKGLYPFGVPTGVALAWGSWGMQHAATGGLAITDDWSTSRILEPGYEQLAEVIGASKAQLLVDAFNKE